MSKGQAIALGAFDLGEELGRGGTAQVRRAVHRRTGLDVAVKVLTGAQARDAEWVASFRREVRVVAGLDHPHVVMVLDHGQIGPEVSQASGGALPVGSPYLVMELAQGGTLVSHAGRLEWAQVRAIVLRLLDALAHAHARGVIHLDIKPANVLLGCGSTVGGSSLTHGLRLADFGISQRFDGHREPVEGEVSLGTPAYMAPEQINADWTEFGPWTDLYSLGALAWALVTGQGPFSEAGGSYRMLYGHLNLEPPPLEAACALPGGFEGWVRRLLAKEPGRRFLRAADAARALCALEETTAGGSVRPALADADDLPTALFAPIDPPTVRVGEVPGRSQPLEQAAVQRRPVDAPIEVPLDWRSPEPPRPHMRLVDAGIGLLGLRQIPMVGRQAERDAIWRALCDVVERGRSKLVLLRGGSGAGKTRLAGWAATRAAELGVAECIGVRHSPTSAPDDGLPSAMCRWLGCGGLDPDEAGAMVSERLGWLGVGEGWLAEGLAEWIQQGSHAGGDVLLGSLFEALGHHRPVVVVLEDVQWGADTLQVVSRLLARQAAQPSRVLFLATVRDDDLAERADASARIERLEARDDVQTLVVAPLDAMDTEKLVSEALRLEGRLAAQVAARTAGNPLFAVQLIGDWVQRGLLRAGARGFVLAEGARADLPDAVHEVWAARLVQLVGDVDGEPMQALERAAVLGQEVVAGDWLQALGSLDPGDAVERLLAVQLARASERGWVFSHRALQESLQRQARVAGRWVDHHRAWARVLEGRADDPILGERLGLHLVEAGELDRAFELLYIAATTRQNRSEYHEAERTAEVAGRVLDMLGAEPHDRRRGEHLARATEILNLQGRLDVVLDDARRLVQLAREAGWLDLQAQGTVLLGRTLRRVGDVRGSLEVLREGCELYRALGNQDRELGARMDYGWALFELGELGQAEEIFDQLLAWKDENGVAPRRTGLLLSIGQLYLDRGELERAREVITEAVDKGRATSSHGTVSVGLYVLAVIAAGQERLDDADAHVDESMSIDRRIGNYSNLALGISTKGRIWRLRGDNDEAERWQRRAMEWWEAMGVAEQIPYIELAKAHLARGWHERAWDQLDDSREHCEKGGQTWLLAHIHAAMLPVAAALGDARAFDRHLRAGQNLLRRHSLADPDSALHVELGAEKAGSAGQIELARRAWDHARDLWQSMDRPDRAEAADRAKQALEA